jgi:hypothetical protein
VQRFRRQSNDVGRIIGPIRREMWRRTTAEPVIDAKAEEGHDGDCVDAELTASNYDFNLLVRWPARFLCALFEGIFATIPTADGL